MRKAVLRLLREHKGFRLLRRRGWHRGTRVRIHGATRFAKGSNYQHTGGKGQIDMRDEEQRKDERQELVRQRRCPRVPTLDLTLGMKRIASMRADSLWSIAKRSRIVTREEVG